MSQPAPGPRVHVVGAGLAGLACATALAEAGLPVRLYESAGQAGGRCRSYDDPVLGRTIDNGNHLMLGGNPELFRYLDRIGARDRLVGGPQARLPFIDLTDGTRWCVSPGPGRLPFWLLNPARRVPGVPLTAYAGLLRLAAASANATVAERLSKESLLYRRLWSPLAVSILNTPPEEASARLLWEVFRRTLLRGADACRPFVARDGLSDALVVPALNFLTARRAEVATSVRLLGISRDAAGKPNGLQLSTGMLDLRPADRVVLAIPAQRAAELLPDLPVPLRHCGILNAHFRLGTPATLPDGAPLVGLVGGTAEWLFSRGDVVSVTVSAADRLMDRPAEELAELIWRDVASALGIAGPCPPHRIIKEKRATFAATPDQERLRPAANAPRGNLLLAGDWTDTGLPATIEGAIQSGHHAAALCLSS